MAGTDIQSIAANYAQDGWRCDRAALGALANGKGAADKALIAKVVQALYAPWLDQSARHFQGVVGKLGENLRGAVKGVAAEKDTCILFVDGLRFDVAMTLKGKLEARSFITNMSHRLAPIPTVTATAKPLATPISKDMEGVPSTEDFAPVLSKSKQPATAQRLRATMQDAGIELLEADEVRIPISADQGGWTEMGRIDYLGHKLGVGLCSQIDEEVEAVADRVVTLASDWMAPGPRRDRPWMATASGKPTKIRPASVGRTGEVGSMRCRQRALHTGRADLRMALQRQCANRFAAWNRVLWCRH